LLFVLVVVLTRELLPPPAASARLPEAQALGPACERRAAAGRAFPAWLVSLLVIAATVGLERIVAHGT
ncbi:MAG TPA: hypothetical protein VHE35_27770, partial [Kofleriaceae bacterium]|nr:hypothetical protein [Kofleriaceae bacterium]